MSIFAGRTLMITGGTGSFGNAVLNRFLRTDVGEIRVFSRDEKKQDVQIQFTGLRDGEKLCEEVLSDAEGTIPTNNPKIMVAKVREYDYEVAKANEDQLLELSYSHDDMAIVRKIKEMVPEYN